MTDRGVVNLEHFIVGGKFRIFPNFAHIAANKDIALFILEKQVLNGNLHVATLPLLSLRLVSCRVRLRAFVNILQINFCQLRLLFAQNSWHCQYVVNRP